MARRQYGHSDETYQVLAGHEAEIAREMECDPSYIYGMKNRSNPDPYPKFREIFRAAARAGADVSHWLNDLRAIAEGVREEPAAAEDLSELFVAKVQGDSLSTEEIYRAIADGHLDEGETHRLIGVMTRVQQNASTIIELLVRYKARLRGDLRNGGRQPAAGVQRLKRV